MLQNLNPNQLDQVRSGIDNYKKVLTEDFEVPTLKFFGSIPFSKEDLDSFIEQNPGMTGVRIYFSKATNIATETDYQITIVPCQQQGYDSENNPIYADMLTTSSGDDSKIMTAWCRNPPGCTTLALFHNQ